MALIIIDGVAMPTPHEMSIGIYDVSKAERNANGYMIMERITTKQKIELSYTFLDVSNLRQILVAITPVFFSVTYPDPVTGANRTGTFYVGDRKLGILDYYDGVPRHKDVAFNFIER